MSREPLNIVILGGSFAGLSVAQKLLNSLKDLTTFEGAPKYRIVLVSPSTHIYWNIGAPRALVSPTWIPLEASFKPIQPGFTRYPSDKFTYVQGMAISMDPSARTISVALTNPSDETSKRASATIDNRRRSSNIDNRWSQGSGGDITQILHYHALIFATGSSADSPLLSLHGPHEKTMAALSEFHKKLPSAESIIIVGGGASGVECAGQIATYFKGKPPKTTRKKLIRGVTPFASASPLFKKKHGGTTAGAAAPDTAAPVTAKESKFKRFSHVKNNSQSSNEIKHASTAASAPPSKSVKKTISIYSGTESLLPNLPPKMGIKAEKQLKSLGVHVVHNVRLHETKETPGRKTHCSFDNDTTLIADLFIAATGVAPNTDYAPPDLIDARGYVDTEPDTLRVPVAGERVFAVGDCASYSKNYVLDVYEAVPVVVKNLMNDLLRHEYEMHPDEKAKKEGLEKLAKADVVYDQNPTDTQLVPITRHGGVGVLFGHNLPSLVVHLMKGRTYKVEKAKGVVYSGKNPYEGP